MKKFFAILCAAFIAASLLIPFKTSGAKKTANILLLSGVNSNTQDFAKVKTLSNSNPTSAVISTYGTYYGNQFALLDKGSGIANIVSNSGIDSVCLSGNDILQGVSNLTQILNASKAKICGANILSSNKQFASNYSVVEKNGIKYGFTSVIGKDTKDMYPSAATNTFSFKDEDTFLKTTLNDLQTQNCNYIIVFLENIDEKTKQSLIDKYGDKVALFVQQGNELKTKRKLLTIDKNSTALFINFSNDQGYTANEIRLEDISEDKSVVKLTKTAENKQAALKDKIIGSTYRDMPCDAETVYQDECDIAYLATDAIKKQTGASAVMLPASDLKASLTSGDIKAGDVLKVMDEDESIVQITLSGSELKEIVQNNFKIENTISKDYVHFAGVSGIYKFDADNNKILNALYVNSKKVSDDKQYKILTTKSALSTLSFNFIQDKTIEKYFGNASMMLYDYVKTYNILASDARFSDKATNIGTENVSQASMSWMTFVAIPLILLIMMFLNKLDPKMKKRMAEADERFEKANREEEQKREEKRQIPKEKKKEDVD